MKVITGPSVYLASRQAFAPGLHDFLDAHGGGWRPEGGGADHPAQGLCEAAGRLCYLSYQSPRPGGNAAYLQHLVESGHGSVLEHAVWGLVFAGVSRSLTHELVRHRAGLAYSELSQRYVDCSDVAFVCPPALLEGKRLYDGNPWQPDGEGWHPLAVAYDAWQEECLGARRAYAFLTEQLLGAAPAELAGTERRKWARQAARSVLPNCTETKVFVTGNARAWRNVIEQRCSRHADAEVRRLFNVVHGVLRVEAPAVFGDYGEVLLPDGTFEITTENRKV